MAVRVDLLYGRDEHGVTGSFAQHLRIGFQGDRVLLEIRRIIELGGVHEDAGDHHVAALAGDPDHKCMGRSAPSRLARALQQADDARLETPLLRQIAARR